MLLPCFSLELGRPASIFWRLGKYLLEISERTRTMRVSSDIYTNVENTAKTNTQRASALSHGMKNCPMNNSDEDQCTIPGGSCIIPGRSWNTLLGYTETDPEATLSCPVAVPSRSWSLPEAFLIARTEPSQIDCYPIVCRFGLIVCQFYLLLDHRTWCSEPSRHRDARRSFLRTVQLCAIRTEIERSVFFLNNKQTRMSTRK